MSTVQDEIAALEERLRVAELGPDPSVFAELLADNVVFFSHDGGAFDKAKVVEAHQPSKGPNFTRVEMTDMQIVDQGAVAIVTCKGTYHTTETTFTLKFMRVWLKNDHRWQIIAVAMSN